MNYTDIICESCKSVKGNFTAQDIYELLLSKGIEIKKGTVNRVINRLYHRGILGRTQHGVYFLKNGQIGGQLDKLKKMKFTDEEIEGVSAYPKREMTVADETKELEEEEVTKFDNPLENVAADAISELKDIALREVDSSSGQPIFLVQIGGTKVQADRDTLLSLLPDIIERYGQKEDKKGIDKLEKDTAELKEMIEKKDKERERRKIEQFEAKMENQIAQLQDEVNSELRKRGMKAEEFVKLFKALNDNGILNYILESAEQNLDDHAKQIKLEKTMTLVEKGMMLANQVDDIDKVRESLKMLKEVTNSE